VTDETSRRWVVTGASRGIGAAIARAAAGAGHRVAVLARTADPEAVARDLGPDALAIAADVTDRASLETAVARVVDAWGGVDVLVNNAGVHKGGRVGRIDRDDWMQVLDTNLVGAFDAVRAVLPAMGAGGSVVNIGAVVGFRGFRGDTAYASAKAGLAGLTAALAMELARDAITVNLVLPGFVETEMTGGLTDAARESIVGRIPLGRVARAEEVADVVLSVAGSTYMTGSVVAVDGGLMAALGSAR
jgi:NAD(P)-dependent dehydrogenase (short-subunit alcohol dehydrogenase family)